MIRVLQYYKITL